MKINDAVIGIKDLELVDWMNSMQILVNNGLYQFRSFDTVPDWEAGDGEAGLFTSGSVTDFYISYASVWLSFRMSSVAGTMTVGTLSISGNVIFGTGTGTIIGTTTNQKLSFYGVTPVVQQAALTVNVGTVTFSEPTTPDYAIASLTSVNGFGFASLDEGHSILKVISNLQTRVNELSTRLTTYGLLST